MDSNSRQILQKAISIRAFEQHVLRAFELGLLKGTTHTCIGQGLLPVTIGALAPKNTLYISNHRNHGHYLSLLQSSVTALLDEIIGRVSGISNGIGGSQHIHSKNFISHGILGGLVPFAVGRSAARNIIKENLAPVILYVGDGTFGEGIIYEALNLANLFSSKLLIVVENNGVSQSTVTHEVLKTDLFQICKLFNPQTIRISDKNFEQLSSGVSNSLKHVNENGKPAILFCDVDRIGPHSKGPTKLDPWYSENDSIYIMSKSNSKQSFQELSKSTYESMSALFNKSFSKDVFVNDF